MASLYGDLPPPETKSKGSKDNNNSKSSNSNSSSQSQTKISKLYNFSPTTKSTVKSIKKPIIPGMNTYILQTTIIIIIY